MAVDHATAVPRGPVWVAQLFLLSLIIPIALPVGELVLMPHRIVLLVTFVPFFFRLFVFRGCGRVLAADWLLFFSALWTLPSLLANADPSPLQPFGVHMLEFFGAYLLARVTIRSGEDFRRMVRTFFVVLLLLLPFAAAESVTKRPIMLDLLPGASVNATYNEPRWGLRRAQTIFAHPILFGVFASTGFALFWYALRPRWVRFVAAPVSLAATFFSLSLGAFISVAVQIGLISWEAVFSAIRRRWGIFAGLFVTGYVTLDLLSNRTPFHLLVDYVSFNTRAAYNRILIWQYGTQNVADNPIFGLGRNEWVRPVWMSSSADNYWLLLTMQFGLPAILAVFLALALLLRGVAKANLIDPADRLARAGYLIVFGALFVAGGTVHYWHSMMAFVMFIYGSGVWAMTGGGSRTGAIEPGQPAQAESRRSRYTRQASLGAPIALRRESVRQR